jgi:hypothetical protein
MDVTVTSTGSLEDALDDLNRSLTKAQRGVGRTMAGVGRRVILDEAKQARGTLSMSRMNVKRLGASAKIRPTPTDVRVILTAKPAGPWAITEYGTARHDIYPRVKKAVVAQPYGVFAHVEHKGARGFHTWQAATAGGGDSKIERAISNTFDAAIDEAEKA